MIALLTTTAKAIIGLVLASALVAGMSCGMWQIVYYGCNCRRNPIQKTALLTIFGLVVVSAAIIKIL